MNYLDAILVHANTRLMQMTAGQYELERVGAENQRPVRPRPRRHRPLQRHPPQRQDPLGRRELQSLTGAGSGPLGRGPERGGRHPAGHPSSSMKASAPWTTRALSRPSGSLSASPRATASWASSPRRCAQGAHRQTGGRKKGPQRGHGGGHCVTASFLFRIACLLRGRVLQKVFCLLRRAGGIERLVFRDVCLGGSRPLPVAGHPDRGRACQFRMGFWPTRQPLDSPNARNRSA